MTKGNILIVGVLDKKGSTNISQAKSFMRFGWNVIPINYRTIIANYGYGTFENTLMYAVEKYRPSLVMFCKCNGVNPELVKRVTQRTKTWLWNPDPIQTIERCMEVVEHAKNATYSSCTGYGVAKWFAEQGVKNCYHIFDGLDYDIFKPVEPDESYRAEISFIGTRTAERDRFIDFLKAIGYDIKTYGQGYGKVVIDDEFAKVCCSSKFMLSINTYNDIECYFSNRLLRYMGCGACVLHYDPTETLKKVFDDGSEILFFKDESELQDKLKIKDPWKIGLNGMNKVLSSLTWDHTIANILNITGLL